MAIQNKLMQKEILIHHNNKIELKATVSELRTKIFMLKRNIEAQMREKRPPMKPRIRSVVRKGVYTVHIFTVNLYYYLQVFT